MFLKNFDIFGLVKRIRRPLILDGAMGSMLQQSGIDTTTALWASIANVEHPDKVSDIHKAYIAAGADIITTNTFRTNPEALKASGLKKDQAKLVKISVNIAKDAKGNMPVMIAGSNAPAEDCYQPERKISLNALEVNHHKHIELLYVSGCDFILNETQSHMDEIKIICSFCAKNSIPFILSLFFTEDLKLLSGEPLSEAIKIVTDYGPLAIGFNCIRPVYFEKVKGIIPEFNWGVYLNCGSGSYTDDIIQCGIDENSYREIIKNLLPYQPSFVGACCGSNPNHIKQIRNLFDGLS